MDKPEYGKQYKLTGSKDDKCISNGNTWKESEVRVCNKCGKQMNKGYCIEGGLEYYCSDKCLPYTDEEWDKMYDNGNSDSYYTEWRE